jgi:hypothetical protein
MARKDHALSPLSPRAPGPIKIALSLALALGAAACASPTGGLSYSLPRATATATVETSLRRCNLEPSAEFPGKFEGVLVLDHEITLDPSYTADDSATYRLNLRKIGGPLRDTEFSAKTYPNGTLQAIGSTVEDKTLQIAESVGRIALSFAGLNLPAGAAAGPSPASTAATVAHVVRPVRRAPPAFCTPAAQRVETAYQRLAAAKRDHALLLADPNTSKEALETAALRVDALVDLYAGTMAGAMVTSTYPVSLTGPGTQPLPLPAEDWKAWIADPAGNAIVNYFELRESANVNLAFESPVTLPGLDTDERSSSAATAACRTARGCEFVALAPLSRLAFRACKGPCSTATNPLPTNEKRYEMIVPTSGDPQFVRLSPSFLGKVSWTLNFDPSGRVPEFKFGENSIADAVEGARTLTQLPEEERNAKMEAEIKRRTLEEKLRKCRADSSKCE